MDYRGTYVSVIMKALDRLEAGEAPVVFGDGSQSYDFVHVEDVARANVLALKADGGDEAFNVGTGVKTSISELVESLIELSGTGAEIDYRPDEQMFVTHRVGSTEKAERLLGFHWRIPLDEGLRSVVEWRREDARAAGHAA